MLRLLLAAAVLLPACTAGTAEPPPADPAAEPAADLGVPLLSREAWGAAAPAFAMRPHTPERLTIHHTATPQRPDLDPAEAMRALQAFSQRADTLEDGRVRAGWADVPYHFYIAPDGTVVEARDPAFEGDSNTGYDLAGHVQVAVEGNFEVETPTAAQVESLLALARGLAARYGIAAELVAGHLDHAPDQTVCPGAALHARLGDVREAVRTATASSR